MHVFITFVYVEITLKPMNKPMELQSLKKVSQFVD
jgi:hypothetical protein